MKAYLIDRSDDYALQVDIISAESLEEAKKFLAGGCTNVDEFVQKCIESDFRNPKNKKYKTEEDFNKAKLDYEKTLDERIEAFKQDYEDTTYITSELPFEINVGESGCNYSWFSGDKNWTINKL